MGILFENIIQIILMLLHPMFLIPTLIIVGIYNYKNKKYKEETYYKVTNVSYSNVRHDVGRYGEYLIFKHLKEFENKGAKFLFNIYVPKNEEETTEIDVLMISKKGLFVFESKNYSGWIFGDESKKYWYQTLPSGYYDSHKEKFYNPIFQNNTHIKYLKTIIGEQIPTHSIIAFSERCTLKNITIRSSNVRVINRYDVYTIVESIYNDNVEDYLTDAQIDEIYNKLFPYTQVSDDIKQKHINDIHNNINQTCKETIEFVEPIEEPINNVEDKNSVNNKVEIENKLNCENVQETLEDGIIESSQTDNKKTGEILTCPDCGSTLILRKARYGQHAGNEFYGCSNYPKCKYIKNKF